MTKEVINKIIFHLTKEEQEVLQKAYLILNEIGETCKCNSDGEFFSGANEMELFDDLYCAINTIQDYVWRRWNFYKEFRNR